MGRRRKSQQGRPSWHDRKTREASGKEKRNGTPSDTAAEEKETQNYREHLSGKGGVLHWMFGGACWLFRKAVAKLPAVANLATVIAFVVAVFQFCVGNWQFDQSGPRYEWFTLPHMSPESRIGEGDTGVTIQNAVGIVVSNTGRTGDSLVAIKRQTKTPETLTVCIPSFDQDGQLEEDRETLLGDGLVRLEPGESRLLFLVSERESMQPLEQGKDFMSFGGGGFEITKDITFYDASGDSRTVSSTNDVPSEVTDYYEGLADYDTGRERCLELAAQRQ